MSRSTNLLRELFTGIHLVAITKVSQGVMTDIIIRFSDGKNKSYDKIYDYTSSEFLKMCNSAGLLKNNAVFSSKEALGTRLWLCIKEVWDVKGTEMTDTVNFYVFDTKPCIDPEKKPIIKGDPADNKGVPSGVFYDCRPVTNWVGSESLLNNLQGPTNKDAIKFGEQDEVAGIKRIEGVTYSGIPSLDKIITEVHLESESDPFDLPPSKPKKVELPAEKKKVIQAAKEMIKKVESGESPKENIFARKLREQEEAKAKEEAKEEVKPTPDEDWDSM